MTAVAAAAIDSGMHGGGIMDGSRTGSAAIGERINNGEGRSQTRFSPCPTLNRNLRFQAYGYFF